MQAAPLPLRIVAEADQGNGQNGLDEVFAARPAAGCELNAQNGRRILVLTLKRLAAGVWQFPPKIDEILQHEPLEIAGRRFAQGADFPKRTLARVAVRIDLECVDHAATSLHGSL